jgi:hypothetical protein
MVGKLPSELTFAYSIINKIRLSWLTYGIVCINNRMEYITNEVLNSKHECVLERYCCSFDMLKRLAGCKLYTKSCLSYPYRIVPFYRLFCTKKSHRKIWDVKCDLNYVLKQDLKVWNQCVLINWDMCSIIERCSWRRNFLSHLMANLHIVMIFKPYGGGFHTMWENLNTCQLSFDHRVRIIYV